MDILDKVEELKKSEVKKIIDNRLKEFEKLGKKGSDDWFSELCFCILTANSKAETAIKIQNKLKSKGFLTLSEEKIAQTIKEIGHRFHNNKAKYIVEARKFKNIKPLIKKEEKENKDPREFIVNNIKGLGYKEASHFLRNVGYKNYAILDRHIINIMAEHDLIEKPKVLNKKNYLNIEKKFNEINEMNSAELDLYLWKLKTGKILK